MDMNKFNIICHADNEVLISDDEDSLQIALLRFMDIRKTFIMEISFEKAMTMVTVKELVWYKHVVNNEILESYEY